MSQRPEPHGKNGKKHALLLGWSFSMKPVRRPVWQDVTDAAQKAHGASVGSPAATGRQRPSLVGFVRAG